MKPFYCCLLMAILVINTFGQASSKTDCTYYAISDSDSVCLDAQVNVDPEEVDRFISSRQKDLLLIFDSWVNWGNRLLSGNNLKNEQIVEYLKNYKIITLYIDDRLLAGGKDSATVGKKNMLYQVDKFAAATQPYYIIIKGGKAKCSEGYMPNPEKILAFFKRCE
jgi:thioredoxin-related protein